MDPVTGSVWRIPGMRALLVASALGFAGYALLLPTAPLWARHGGADEGGAGLVNAILMLATVLVQTTVPWALRTIGWRATMVTGAVLLGAPSLLFMMSDALWAVLAVSALRGAGFAVVTVCGSSAVAHLVPESHRGRAIGIYGLSIAVPQFLLIPSSAWIAENVDFRVIFLLGFLPVLAVPFAAAIGGRIDRAPQDDAPRVPVTVSALAAVLVPALVLTAIAAPAGAIISFAPQFGFGGATVLVALLILTGVTAFARWLAGGYADRYGPHRFIAPLLVAGALGLVASAFAILWGSAPLVWGGMVLVGIAYGGIQNLTLVESFGSVPQRLRELASTSWNIGFDTGTGLGSLVVGFIAAGTSFTVGLGVTAAVCVVTAACYLGRLRGLKKRAVPYPA